MDNFIKNKTFIEEDHKINDLLAYDKHVDSLNDFLFSIGKTGIVGLVGRFGIGKSTLLYQLEKQEKEKKIDSIWITFDAWKFPDRQNLWEGFVLEFARQIDPVTFKNIRKKIDGEDKDDVKTLIKTISQGINLFLPGAGILENLNHFFKTSPARRTFEIQDILTEMLSKQTQGVNINIVIEDIDRSGDHGVFFLETLHQFLKSLSLENQNRVLAIAPISEDSYYENLESYLKCVDYFEFFNPRSTDLGKFIDTVFDESIVSDEIKRGQILSFLNALFVLDNSMTIRKLKLILRKASINYVRQRFAGFDPDFRMTILFEAAKHIKHNTEGGKNSYFDYFRNNKGISSDPNIFNALLWAIHLGKDDIYQISGDKKEILYNGKLDFKFIIGNKEQKNIPWIAENMYGDNSFFVKDFYLNY